MTTLPFAATTPIHVSRVGLKSRDGASLARFYRHLLGLDVIAEQGASVTLGAGGRPLLEISTDPSLRPDDPRSAGLFHTAFLLPSHRDLARWLAYAASAGIRISGASDHLVSRAVYLDDPDGNGIEIYADRAPEEWPRDADGIAMATERLDVDALMATITGENDAWTGAPDGTVIGHVHLRVGDPATAQAWWAGTLGLDTMARYGDAAVFLASGGYHHHVGANAWRSRGAGLRERDRAGLDYVELLTQSMEATTLTDPWGTEIRIA